MSRRGRRRRFQQEASELQVSAPRGNYWGVVRQVFPLLREVAAKLAVQLIFYLLTRRLYT